VTGEDIYKLKDGSVWTNGVPGTMWEGTQFHNDAKGITGHHAQCRSCSHNFGAIYTHPWPGIEPDRKLPCAKLTHLREGKLDGKLFNHVVLSSGSRAGAERAVSLLELSGVATGGIRTTKNTWELTKQLQSAKEREDEMQAQLHALGRKAARRPGELSSAELPPHEYVCAITAGLMLDPVIARDGHTYERAAIERWFASNPLGQPSGTRSPMTNERLESHDLMPNRALKRLIADWCSCAAGAGRQATRSAKPGAQQDEIQARLEELALAGGAGAAPAAPPAPPLAPGVGLGSKPWTMRPKRLADGAEVYQIARESLLSGEDTREQDEFNFALGQVARLHSAGTQLRVQQVDVYNAPLLCAVFASKKEAMPDAGGRELWVFHGTTKSNISSIMLGGFKVGGQDDGCAVVNGTAFGHGIYTATGPATPMQYAKGDSCVILAKALEGQRGAQEAADSWSPKDDWLIFKSGEQLWPQYVVHLAR
jgi:hypothetical protein